MVPGIVRFFYSGAGPALAPDPVAVNAKN